MNRSHRLYHALLGLLALLLAMSCKPRVPREYISPGEMENILYDYHLADAVYSTRENYSDTLGMHVYKAAILKKYGRTEAEFDSSMVYYMRHSDRLQDIYERLSKRLSDNAVAHGTPEGSVARTTFTANGDTANVWNGELAYVLTPKKGFDHVSFRIDPDTSFHKGDKFELSFDTQFIYQDGHRDGLAMLFVKYSNDSVATRYVHMSQASHYKVEIADPQRLGVKVVSGYFLVNRSLFDNRDSKTTLKLHIIYNIMLLRMHIAETKAEDKQNQSSTQIDAASDAPIQLDTSKAKPLTSPKPIPKNDILQSRNPNMPPGASLPPPSGRHLSR